MARKKLFYGSPNKAMDFMSYNDISATLYSIANTLFMLEKEIKSGNVRKSVSLDYYTDISSNDIKHLSILLKNVVLDVLCEKVEFKFIKKDLKLSKKKKLPRLEKIETICLFSGGIDSTLGILESKKKYQNVLGLYVAHQDMGKITHKIDIIKKDILDKNCISMIKLIAPAMGKGYSQLRGFLYILYGTILSNLVDAKRIIIAECGVTMYQPKFAPMDSITYTTNPLVLKTSKKVAEIVLKRTIDLILPFEDFTKTEMIKLIPDDSLLSKTHSCLSARWNKNCGGCYACITRMVGSINLGLSVDYFKSYHFEKNNEIISSLLNFCINFELNKQDIDYWSSKTINLNNKEDLFHRHALDVLLCLSKLSKQSKLDDSYNIVLDIYKKERGDEQLVERERKLSLSCEPNFNKKSS